MVVSSCVLSWILICRNWYQFPSVSLHHNSTFFMNSQGFQQNVCFNSVNYFSWCRTFFWISFSFLRKGKINQFHGAITKNTEILEIEYLSSCKEKSIFLETLRKNRGEDIAKGYTKAGIHRDDFTISINGKSVSVFGSQGQQRTAIISLKLSELEVIYDEIGEYPILLLDDFMSELDDTRIQNLLEKMKENQVIITCTDNLKVKNQESKCFHIQNGRIVQD